MPTDAERFEAALVTHAPEFELELGDETIARLRDYYELLMKWNARLHLVAPCSAEEFATRHVLESLMLLRHLPPNASVVDIGSGGGLPIIPCLLMREDLHATLIESSGKKAVFLREALRMTQPAGRGRIVVEPFENLEPPDAGFVT